MILLYGAGEIGKKYIAFLQSKRINDFVVADSDICKCGEQILGHEIISIYSVPKEKISIAVITTEDNYYYEILDVIKSVLNNVPVTSYREAIVISDSDVINFGSVKLKKDIKPGVYEYSQLISFFDDRSYNDLDTFVYTKKHRLIHKYIHYMEAYDRFFSRFRYGRVKVLEIGVYKGGSLQMWKDYFGDKADIFGIDIDERCYNFREKDVEIIIGDQNDENFLEGVKKRLGSVDVIIDDGGHTMEQQKKTFEYLFEIVNDGGVYLCEDTHTSYWKEYGGAYKDSQSFIEYSKNIIDLIHEQYFDSLEFENKYIGQIKSLSFYDSMVFIEKKSFSNRSIALKIEN